MQVCGCGNNIKPGDAFCTNCGAKTGRQCPSCSAPVAADAQFCNGCGTRLNNQDVSATPTLVPVTQENTPAASLNPPGQTAGLAVQTAVEPPAPDTAPPPSPQPVFQPAPATDFQRVPFQSGPFQPAPSRSRAGLVFGIVALLAIALIAAWMLRPSQKSYIGVTIFSPEPSSVTVSRGQTVPLGVLVSGTTPDVFSWELQERDGGSVKTAGVEVSGRGVVFKADYTAPSHAGDYHVIAGPSGNPQASAIISVHVK